MQCCFFSLSFVRCARMKNETQELQFKNVALVGMGKRGVELARCIVEKSIDVVLYDVNETLLRRAIELLKNEFRHEVQQRRLSPEKMEEALSHIKTKTSLPDIGNCDVIIETVPDDIRIKKDLFKHLDTHGKGSALLVTTTSLFTVASVASLAKNNERIVGFRFPQSIATSKIVEVVPTLRTKSTHEKLACAVVERIDKVPILTKDLPGSIVEHALQAWYGEALRIIEDTVVKPAQVDRLVTLTHLLPEGPFQQMDERGLDTICELSKAMFQQRFYDVRFQPSMLLQQMVELGMTGKKTKHGFYV